MTPERILDEFPAPSYRGRQREALEDIREAFRDGNDVVLVRAPTGSGKSLLARAIMGCARRVADAAPSDPTGAYYTTPQVSQLDDVAGDDLLSDLQIIRGKSNYTCIIQGEETTPVDRAPCARERGYDCAVKHRCPYFSDRAIAASREYAAMTLAYFMRTAGSEVFRTRDVVVVDEAHGLAEWAEMYATIDLSPRTVPVWDDVEVPEFDGLDRAVRFAENLRAVCERRKDDLLAQEGLSAEEAARRDRLQELRSELGWFVEDYRDPQSPTTWVIDQDDDRTARIKPMNPERYLQHTVWDRGRKFALLSATILDKDAFCRQVGLDPNRVALVDVEHTFPLENRPLYDVTCGKMTFEEREETLPRLARTVARVMAAHPDEKGLIHAHSYDIQADLADRLRSGGFGDRIRTHGRDDRDAALGDWMASDDPEVFLAVTMEEALDLEGDLARWQVICKAPYRNASDSRVAARLEDGQWAWYYRDALRTLIQACGRVVRAPDDYGATYLADDSILEVFERARVDVPGWFAEQVAATSVPDLPDVDFDGGPVRDPAGRGSSGGSSGPRESDRSNDGDGRAADARNRGQSGGERGTPRRASDDSDSGTVSGNRAVGSGRSPLADVWDPE